MKFNKKKCTQEKGIFNKENEPNQATSQQERRISTENEQIKSNRSKDNKFRKINKFQRERRKTSSIAARTVNTQ